jgi:hypothetical protein
MSIAFEFVNFATQRQDCVTPIIRRENRSGPRETVTADPKNMTDHSGQQDVTAQKRIFHDRHNVRTRERAKKRTLPVREPESCEQIVELVICHLT